MSGESANTGTISHLRAGFLACGLEDKVRCRCNHTCTKTSTNTHAAHLRGESSPPDRNLVVHARPSLAQQNLNSSTLAIIQCSSSRGKWFRI